MSNSIPIFSAERNHGEVIEGDFYADKDVNQYFIDCRDACPHAIKIETLKMSIDGENFYSMEEVREALALLYVRSAMVEYDEKLKRGEL